MDKEIENMLMSKLRFNTEGYSKTPIGGFMTFINLFNCFFTCSTDSSSVTIVIFDLPSIFVGPTESELILKPLLEIVEEILANTPGLSSTSTLKILSLIFFSNPLHLG